MKIKPQFGLEVGISNGGHIRLGQDRSELCEQHVVLLSPYEAEMLISELTQLLDVKDQWWMDGLEQDEDE